MLCDLGLVFPLLFMPSGERLPDGTPDLANRDYPAGLTRDGSTRRARQLTISDWGRYLISCHDMRYARDPKLRFVLQNLKQRDQAKSKVSFTNNATSAQGIATPTLQDVRAQFSAAIDIGEGGWGTQHSRGRAPATVIRTDVNVVDSCVNATSARTCLGDGTPAAPRTGVVDQLAVAQGASAQVPGLSGLGIGASATCSGGDVLPRTPRVGGTRHGEAAQGRAHLELAGGNGEFTPSERKDASKRLQRLAISIACSCDTLTGSPPYWWGKRKEVEALVHALLAEEDTLPAAFISASMAE